MMSPTSGARPSNRPKIREGFTDRAKDGFSPPSTSEVRKLSRLKVNPSESSEITCVARAIAAGAGDRARQVGSHRLLRRGQVPDPSVAPNREATKRYGNAAHPR